jgi:OPT family oligopeptide transporter
MPVNTFRAWFLGMVFAILLAGVNQFFFFRYPSVTVPGLVAQLLAFPAGKLMEYAIPRSRFFNPGPFNIKEHTLITIMAGVAYQSAYATDIIAVQRVFYNQIWSFAYQILLIISTQMIGFAFAGFSRRFRKLHTARDQS